MRNIHVVNFTVDIQHRGCNVEYGITLLMYDFIIVVRISYKMKLTSFIFQCPY